MGTDRDTHLSYLAGVHVRLDRGWEARMGRAHVGIDLMRCTARFFLVLCRQRPGPIAGIIYDSVPNDGGCGPSWSISLS
jgi:hypothetical protein